MNNKETRKNVRMTSYLCIYVQYNVGMYKCIKTKKPKQMIYQYVMNIYREI